MRPRSASETHKVIAHATASVPTATLTQRGVERLRILSQSKFIHLVRRLVEDELRRRLALQSSASGSAKPVAAPPAEAEVYVLDDDLRDCHDKATPAPPASVDAPGNVSPGGAVSSGLGLREKQLEAIARLEERLATLGDSVRSLESLAKSASGGDPPPASTP
jgi:hypothetical protein